MRTGFNSLKDEYERNIEKGILTFREEYSTVVDKINSLKTDCLKAVDHANALKDELINLFEQYSMFNRLQTREI